MRPEPLSPLPTMEISEELEILSISETNSTGSRGFPIRQSVYSHSGLRSEPDELTIEHPAEGYHSPSPHPRQRDSSISELRSNSGSRGVPIRQSVSSRQDLRSEPHQETRESPVEGVY